MVSTAMISDYLEGLDFPATKQEIVDYAEERSAPDELLDALDLMLEPSDGYFFSITSVWDAAGAFA